MRRTRKPTSPGEILRDEFLVPLGLTQKRLADHIGCDVKVINRLINGRTSVTAEMALKLGAAFGSSPEFWLNAQKGSSMRSETLLTTTMALINACEERPCRHGAYQLK